MLLGLSLGLRSRPLGAQSTPATAKHFPCLDSAGTVRRARLDAKHLIFTEQQTVVAQRDGRILVAGNPVYVWRDRGDHWEWLARDSLFGMIVDSSQFVHAIPSPLPGRVLDGIRAAPLADGWWLVTFADVISHEMPKPPTVLGMWAGETDGSRWRNLQRLPQLTDSLELPLSSMLVWRNARARLVVPFRKELQRRAVVYSLDSGRWSASISEFNIPPAMFAIALSDTTDLLMVVGAAVDAIPDMNSLFLYTRRPRETRWSQKHLIVRAGEEPVYDPMFVGGDARLLTWRKSRNGQRDFDVWYTTYDEATDSVARPTMVGSGAMVFPAIARGSHILWAISDRRWPGPSVHLVESDGSRIAVMPRHTRYRGLLGLASSGNQVVLVAAESAPTPRDPAVVSLIETHTWRCLDRGDFP